MIIKVIRKWFTTRATVGEIFIIDDQFKAFSIEDVARADGVKIKRETAIPAGNYKVGWTWSPRHNMYQPQILDVSMFEGIRFDVANYAEDVEGCIGVGYGRGENAVWDSKKAHAVLCGKIQDALKDGEPVWVNIENKPEAA